MDNQKKYVCIIPPPKEEFHPLKFKFKRNLDPTWIALHRVVFDNFEDCDIFMIEHYGLNWNSRREE